MISSITLRWRRAPVGNFGTVVVLSLLAGCTAPQQQPEDASRPEPSIAEVTQELEQRQARWREQRRARVEELLAEADRALADGRLTLPEHDNAYDRYAAVLLLDRDNERAEAGLQSILLSYVDLIRTALRNNKAARARQLLTQAQEYYDDNPLLREMRDAITQAEAQARKRRQALSDQDLDATEIELPPDELSRRSEEVVKLVTRVAERLRETDESVLIRARSDAEGRWIYQQMRDAVPGYRIRGDIRVAPRPALIIMPPL